MAFGTESVRSVRTNYIPTYLPAYPPTHLHKCRQTNRQTDRRTARQASRKTDRQTGDMPAYMPACIHACKRAGLCRCTCELACCGVSYSCYLHVFVRLEVLASEYKRNAISGSPKSDDENLSKRTSNSLNRKRVYAQGRWI